MVGWKPVLRKVSKTDIPPPTSPPVVVICGLTYIAEAADRNIARELSS